jgi:hypothetical protein
MLWVSLIFVLQRGSVEVPSVRVKADSTTAEDVAILLAAIVELSTSSAQKRCFRGKA